MYLGDSIGKAVEELWQLAMTMASLKYIAGMVSQDLDSISASTGQEEDNKQPTETHRPSQVDKKEACSDNSLANNEVIDNEEIELAAFISSLTLTKVGNQNQIPDMEETKVPIIATSTTELLENKNETESASTVLSSMVAHQLSQVDSPLETPEMLVSMAAHVIATNVKDDGDHLFDIYENISMTVHQITNVDIAVEQDVVDFLDNIMNEERKSGICTIHVEKEIEVNDESEIVTNSNEGNVAVNENLCASIEEVNEENILTLNNVFIPSMCTHEVSCIETPIETPEYQVSMVAHYQSVTEDNCIEHEDDSLSMVCHQTKMNYDEEACQKEQTATDSAIWTSELLETDGTEPKAKHESTFITSMVAHQLPAIDAPFELSELPVSMAVHVIVMDDGEPMIETKQNISMIAHQITSEDKSVMDIEGNVSDVEELCVSIQTMDEENFFQTESNLISTLCTNQLFPIETLLENPNYPVSMAVHKVDTCSVEDTDIISQTDPGMISSMVSHQIVMEENSKAEGLAVDCPQSIAPFESIEIYQQPFFSSMVAHQLPFLETPTEFSDFLLSAATYGYVSRITEEDINEPESSLMTSMVAHHNSIDTDHVELVLYNKDDKSMLDESVLLPSAIIEEAMHQHLIIEDRESQCIPLTANFEFEDASECELKFSILQCIQEDFVEESHYDPISMVTHQLPASEIPTQFSEFLASTVAHRFSSKGSEYFIESGLDYSMVAHQNTNINPQNVEDDIQHCSVIIPKQGIDLEENETITEDTIKEYTSNETTSFIRGIECDLEDTVDIISMVSHQLPFLAICDQSESPDCITSMTAHQDIRTVDENGNSLLSMATHLAGTDTCEDDLDNAHTPDQETMNQSSDVFSIIDNQVIVKINKAEGERNEQEDYIEPPKLVENINSSYTEDSQANENNEKLPQNKENISSNCQGKRPVGKEEDEEISESSDNFVNVAQNIYNEANKTKLIKIQELQSLVEDEIEEFENKRKNIHEMTENNVEATETHIVSNFKGVEFKSCIVIHQTLNKEYETEDSEESVSDEESVQSSAESINSVIFAASDKLNNHIIEDEFSSGSASEMRHSVENLIEASCTIENNSPVIITTSNFQTMDSNFEDELSEEDINHESEENNELDDMQQEDNFKNESGHKLETKNQEEENGNDKEFNELKMHLRKMPPIPSNIETKIRETEMLNSLFPESLKQTIQPRTGAKCKKNEKPLKSPTTLATFNKNVSKQTYKIRFKVKLNEDSSKSSVLKYLFGCFGGEKLFNQQQ